MGASNKYLYSNSFKKKLDQICNTLGYDSDSNGLPGTLGMGKRGRSIRTIECDNPIQEAQKVFNIFAEGKEINEVISQNETSYTSRRYVMLDESTTISYREITKSSSKAQNGECPAIDIRIIRDNGKKTLKFHFLKKGGVKDDK